ncbi:ABC transporter permease [Gracilibacillus sp. YIM 98692]|uniref:ABC transporter permease n=1 Tax=Gracilibacillus sp. YIM 98692 TaxID=2663532 RepID=UPI0013D34EDF|nr:ABC transporter permease [Gracilibacillus sp. YIM 98692]
MKFKDQWRFVRRNMKRSKSRIFMTVLATAMGCAFLIVLASVGFGLHDTLVKDMLENRTVTQIQIAGKDHDGEFQQITDKEIEELESMENIKAVTRRMNLRQSPTYQIEDYTGYGQTVVAHFPSEIKAGLELADGRLPEADNEVVVGSHFSEQLVSTESEQEEIYDENGDIKEAYQYDEGLAGKEIDMIVTKSSSNGEEEESKTISLKVTGVVEAPARDWMRDNTVYISKTILAEVGAFTGTARGARSSQEDRHVAQNSEGYDEVYGYANSMEEISDISSDLKDQGYHVYSAADELKNLNMLFTIAKTGLIFIGTIAIIIASIGIYNTMTMAVTERTPDIGIMKAMGAHPKKIKQIFLLESSYIGLLGAIIGTIAAYLISLLVNTGLPMILEAAFQESLPEGFKFSAIPLSLILISVGICLLVTIISGLKPAKRATQVDVLKAIRREI